jgi:hypothetical protein
MDSALLYESASVAKIRHFEELFPIWVFALWIHNCSETHDWMARVQSPSLAWIVWILFRIIPFTLPSQSSAAKKPTGCLARVQRHI